jgi:Bax protein
VETTRIIARRAAFVLAIEVAVSGCSRDEPPSPTPPPINLASTDEIRLYHARITSPQELDALLAGFVEEGGVLRVPNVAPARPQPMLDVVSAERRKEVFFRTILPLVLYEKLRIVEERERLVRLLDPTQAVSPAYELKWLTRLMNDYRLKRLPTRTLLLYASLLPRVDVVPVPIVLAQAAMESGWGGSRFVRSGNALFGELTFDSNELGIIPAARDSGAIHRVQGFESIQASIREYMRNLNTHPAYREFRALRHAQRLSGQPLDPFALAETLHRYSERGDGYVAQLQAVIRDNQLMRYQDAALYPVGLDFLARFEIVEDEPAPLFAARSW